MNRDCAIENTAFDLEFGCNRTRDIINTTAATGDKHSETTSAS